MKRFRFRSGLSIRTGVIAIVAISTLAATGGVVGATVRPAKAAPQTVNMMLFEGGPNTWLSNVAYLQGIFRKNNLIVNQIPIASTTVAVAALASGSIDTAESTPETFISDAGAGDQIEIIDSSSTGILEMIANNTIPKVPGNLKAQLQQLKGHTILVSTIGSSVQYVTEGLMSWAGLSYPQDYSFAAVTGAAAQLTAMEQNRVQAWVAVQPDVDDLVYADQGYIIDNFASPAERHTAPLDLTSGFPDDTMWADTGWVTSHKTAVKAIQKSMAQAYVFVHNKKNFATAEADTQSVFGTGSIPPGFLVPMTDQLITNSCAWEAKTDIVPFVNFDLSWGFLHQRLAGAALVAPGTPSNKAQAVALAAS